MKFKLIIKPAIIPKSRHKIEEVLKQEGYHICGGGTNTDMSSCDVSFEDDTKEELKNG